MKRESQQKQESGYILLGVVFLLTLSLFVLGTAIQSTQNAARTVVETRGRSVQYYEAEAALNSAIQWLRDNSTSMALSFSRSNFYSTFDRVDPEPGSNEGNLLNIPTRLRLNGSEEAPVLSNADIVGEASFPTITDTVTGESFDAATNFSGNAFGGHLVRVTLVDAVPHNPTADYGDTDEGNAAPATDFSPVYRIDALSAADRGKHLVGYLVGSLVMDYGMGFYGKNYLEMRQSCDSYLSNAGPYSLATRRANCSTGSDAETRIHGQEAIYGTSRTNGYINETTPFGGQVCADFSSGCPNPGQTCEGTTCNVPALPTYSTWNSYCPSNQGNVTISASTTLTVAGNNANQKCWNSVKINSSKVLTLTSTNYPYFIDTFDIANNGRINFAPNPSTGTINLYVRSFVGDKFNGNQVYNINNKPYQLRIHYLGENDLTMNGTADMNAFVVAPYATVNIQGNFTMSGGVKAEALLATGSGELHYDESGDITTISDTTYRLRNVEEVYR